MSEFEGWVNTTEAATLTGYSQAYMRMLAHSGQVEARKMGRDWLINRESLLAYKHQMDVLGPEKHNPWREDLTDQERGRRGD
jgi:excisionase family DNA binding protein